MNIAAAKTEIDAILNVLEEAKRYSGLGPHDPAVLELERIMLRKVAELEAAKTEAVQAIEEQAATPFQPSSPLEN